MSEFQELPGAEAYVEVMHGMDRDMRRSGSDLYDTLHTFKKRHEASESFYKLAHSAARTGFAFEVYNEDGILPVDSHTRRAKAFVQGILTAEMINLHLFNEEFRHTAFLWLVSTFPEYDSTDESMTYQSLLQEVLTSKQETFSASLYPVSVNLLDEWSECVASTENQRYFRIGAGVNLAAAYSYRSYKNDSARNIDAHTGGRDG